MQKNSLVISMSSNILVGEWSRILLDSFEERIDSVFSNNQQLRILEIRKTLNLAKFLVFVVSLDTVLLAKRVGTFLKA